ncbi:MAG: hypothetical protein WAN93_00805 [Solirubrobacteraceae bacterium]
MLDEIGWIGEDPPVEIHIDLRAHRTVLLTAARNAREAADHAFSEVQEGRVKDPPERLAITERVLAMRDFSTVVEVKVRQMQHERRTQPIHSMKDLNGAITTALAEVEVPREDIAALSDVDSAAIDGLAQGESDLRFLDVLRVLQTLGLDLELSHRLLSPSQIAARDTPPLLIPAQMERSLRSGLITVLCTAAEHISRNGIFPEREQHPEWYTGYREDLEAACALLDEIGWADTPQPTEKTIDLYTHRWALSEALKRQLDIAETDLQEAGTVDAERVEQGEPPERKSTVEHVRALRKFAASVKARVDALAEP